MIIAVGADHAGFDLKECLRAELSRMGHQVIDVGCTSRDPCDYTEYARQVAFNVVEGKAELGVLVCSTGIGTSITANRYSGVRAALCHNCDMAYVARSHNDANILVLGSRYVTVLDANAMLRVFLGTGFSREERHRRRIQKIDSRQQAYNDVSSYIISKVDNSG